MAGGPSVYVANFLLNKSLKDTNFTPPSTFYVALFTVTSEVELRGNNVAAAGEVSSGSGYSRLPVLSSQISSSTLGQSQITVDIVLNPATASWGTVYQAALMDSATIGAGNVWYFGPLSASATVQPGDVFKIPALTFNINL